MDQQHLDGLYLCDPGKNADCRGTVCFWRDDCWWHWCAFTTDPACAVTGPDGAPIRIDRSMEPIMRDRREPEGPVYAMDNE